MTRSSSTEEVVVRSRADCVAAGVIARKLARVLGFDAKRAEELGLVVVELTSNAVRHAGEGVCRLSAQTRAVKVEVEDGGPGFPEAVLQDAGRSDRLGKEGPLPPGERQGRGLGSGLACARRLSDELTLANRARGGAVVTAVCAIKKDDDAPWRRKA